MVPLDFFENVEEEKKNDIVDAEEDVLPQAQVNLPWTLALTQKGKIQFLCGGRKYQVKSQTPTLCEIGSDCVLKLYCAQKGCQVSAYVNRAVKDAEPVSADFTD